MSEEEFYAALEEKYGALLEEETPGPGEGSLYAALEEVTEIKYSEPADSNYKKAFDFRYVLINKDNLANSGDFLN